jgi:hypothetical protein
VLVIDYTFRVGGQRQVRRPHDIRCDKLELIGSQRGRSGRSDGRNASGLTPKNRQPSWATTEYPKSSP